MEKTIHSLFKKGSKTYFYSTLFFPKAVKGDVSILYAFVRKADDFVDSIPQQTRDFYSFRDRYQEALQGTGSGDIVIDSFLDLMERRDFKLDWVDAFFASMEADIYKDSYATIGELEEYLYGSSEVVGLMMANIMELPRESYDAARYLGKAMQYINFIRDIEEDLRLGRSYLPADEMRCHGIESLDYDHVVNHPEGFREFIGVQIERYWGWIDAAERGFPFIPRRFLIPIKTASDMYMWTAKQILQDPLVVYSKKMKPSLYRVLGRGLSNAVKLRDWRSELPSITTTPTVG